MARIFFSADPKTTVIEWSYVDDVDTYYNSIKSTGAKIVALPQSKEWNMREMLVKYPDGHIIRFANRIECE